MSAAGSVRFVAAGVLAVVLGTGFLFGRAWERRTAVGAGDLAVADSTAGETAGEAASDPARRNGGRGGGPGRLFDEDLEPFERLRGSMLGQVEGLDETQVRGLFAAWDSARAEHERIQRDSWESHWEGGGFEARYDPIRAIYRPIYQRADSLLRELRSIRSEAQDAYEATEDSLRAAQDEQIFNLIYSFLTPEQVAQYDSIREARQARNRGRSASRGEGGGQSGG